MSKVFHLSAGLGDIIYSLPTVKLMGGGTFVYGGGYKAYEVLKSLLESQSYINECKHVSEIDLPRDFINLDLFRNNPLGNKVHLVDLFLTYFGFSKYNWNEGGWLENIPDLYPNNNYSIINVTPRYRDKIFEKLNLWDREIKYHEDKELNVIFLGLKEDFNKFYSEVKNKQLIHYVYTLDLLDAASHIKGASLFSGTQSSLLAIREALGLPYRFEQSPNHVDVNQYSKNETIINPWTRRLHLLIVSLKKIIQGKN